MRLPSASVCVPSTTVSAEYGAPVVAFSSGMRAATSTACLRASSSCAKALAAVRRMAIDVVVIRIWVR
jgi:hypothetical protein